MPDILVRNISAQTIERLQRRAKRHGRSLEAELRETLESMGQEERPATRGKAGFGTWLATISRPGADMPKILAKVRSAPPRAVDVE